MSDSQASALYSPGGPIVLAPYDAEWTTAFTRESAEISRALGAVAVVVHHIGSTAVAGLLAKPVIDIMVVATNLAGIDEGSTELVQLGYVPRGEFGIPGRRYFQKTNVHGVRTHQIHAYARGDDALQRHLDFRDYLRAHPDAAQDYAQLKLQLAAHCGCDIEAYAVGKTAFVRDVITRAAQWRARADS